MAESPSVGASDVIQLQVKSNGSELAAETSVIAVRTRAEMNRVPEAVIVVADGSVATNEFPTTNGSTLIAGAKIEIKVGYGSASPQTIFSGVVVKTRLRVGSDRPLQLEATCRDESFRLTLGRKSAVYEKKTDSDIISSILSEASLEKSVESTSTQHEALIRQSCSDFDFILARAEANGLLFSASEGKATVAAPNFSASAKLKVTLGVDLFSFEGEIDARTQVSSATAAAWDAESQASISEAASVGSGSSWGNQSGNTLAEVGKLDALSMITSAQLAQTDLTAYAKARQTRAALARLRGVARFQGNADAELSGTLELAGLGDRFNGTGLICGVSHRIETGDWTTEVQLGMEPDWRADDAGMATPGAAGVNAPMSGLQIGKVVAVAPDPDGAQRIQIKLPMIGDDAQVWARLGGVYASSGFGAMFLPETDDEVVVGFLDDDPSSPVVLGSLYSKNRKMPETAEKENNTKTLWTREKMKLTFDEEKKIITVETPAGNKGVFDDDAKSVTLSDQNGNKVELAEAGITLSSPKNITLKAEGDVSVSANGSISASAEESLSLSAMSISASADSSFSAEGRSDAKLTSSGAVTIQGSIVNIN